MHDFDYRFFNLISSVGGLARAAVLAIYLPITAIYVPLIDTILWPTFSGSAMVDAHPLATGSTVDEAGQKAACVCPERNADLFAALIGTGVDQLNSFIEVFISACL